MIWESLIIGGFLGSLLGSAASTLFGGGAKGAGEWLGDKVSGIGNNIADGVGDQLGSAAQAGVGSAIGLIKSPEEKGAEAGAEAKAYHDKVNPGTNAWERLGQGNSANQSIQQTTARDTNKTAVKVARINAQATKAAALGEVGERDGNRTPRTEQSIFRWLQKGFGKLWDNLKEKENTKNKNTHAVNRKLAEFFQKKIDEGAPGEYTEDGADLLMKEKGVPWGDRDRVLEMLDFGELAPEIPDGQIILKKGPK